MARFEVPNLAQIRQNDRYLYEALTAIEGAVNNHSDQGNLDPNGAEQAAPAPISQFTASAQDGWHDLKIVDNAPAYRGLNYFAYYSKTPDMANVHKIDLGSSQNHRVYLGPGQFYWAANHAYPTSAGSPMVYHGGATPKPVGIGAYAGPAMSAAQGTQAFGAIYRNSLKPPIRGASPTAITSGPLPSSASDTAGTSPGGGGGGSAVVPSGAGNQVYATPDGSSGRANLRPLVEDDLPEITEVNGAAVPLSASSLATNADGQLIPGSAGSLLGWGVSSGVPATDIGLILSASRTTSIDQCVLTVTASDATTDLTFDIQQAGVSIFSAPPTITHGATLGQKFTLALKSASVPVAQNDNFNLNVIAGTSSWKFAVYVR